MKNIEKQNKRLKRLLAEWESLFWWAKYRDLKWAKVMGLTNLDGEDNEECFSDVIIVSKTFEDLICNLRGKTIRAIEKGRG